MTCAQHATGETQYHAIVALCFTSYAITIDHSLHPTAFKVPLGGAFAMFAYIPLFGSRGQERFKYFLSESGTYMLTMDSCIISYPALSFTPQDVSTTISQLAVPAASELKPLKDNKEVSLPPRKYISVRTLLDEEPKHISSVPLHGKFLTTAMRVQVDFDEPALLLQIPLADWLHKLQGKKWARLMEYEGYVQKCEATAHVVVKLGAKINRGPSQLEYKQTTLLGTLAQEFGIDGRVINEMTDAIFRAWAPFRETLVVTVGADDNP
jgi:hypothetical protein